MNKIRFRMLVAAAIFIVVGIGISLAVTSPNNSVSGHGTMLVTNQDGNNVRRQFSVNARKQSDGSARGSAILHNPTFTVDNGQNYMLHVEISCMNVIGNTVVFGGTTRRTNDPNLIDAVYFTVQDRGEPGPGSDKISSAFFFDDDPKTQGDPALCLNNHADDFPLMPIEAGNIQVK